MEEIIVDTNKLLGVFRNYSEAKRSSEIKKEIFESLSSNSTLDLFNSDELKAEVSKQVELILKSDKKLGDESLFIYSNSKYRKRKPKNPVHGMDLPNTPYIGAAGEMAVISELLFRGYNANRMIVDEGVDVVAVKDDLYYYVQVKTTSINEQGRMLHQEKYRDCFMLMFYLVGINICDLLSLLPSSIISKNACTYIVYKRAKTGRDYAIKIEPEARTILDKYKGKKHLLCWADDWGTENFKTRMNKELKKIGPYVLKGRGGKKVFSPITPSGLSGYWARHTWATIAAQLDVPVEIIGHALGHADTRHHVTNIYIDFNSDKIDQANRTVLDSL